MNYAVILTRIRPGAGPRDERRDPEPVICRCVFDQRRTAEYAARTWASDPAVRHSRERVKLIAVEPAP